MASGIHGAEANIAGDGIEVTPKYSWIVVECYKGMVQVTDEEARTYDEVKQAIEVIGYHEHYNVEVGEYDIVLFHTEPTVL